MLIFVSNHYPLHEILIRIKDVFTKKSFPAAIISHNCFNYYSKCSIKSQAKLRVQARNNFFNNPSKDWSLIDSLSFRVRNENFFNAWYFGSGLPSIVVEAINKGLIDTISILPSMLEVSHE